MGVVAWRPGCVTATSQWNVQIFVVEVSESSICKGKCIKSNRRGRYASFNVQLGSNCSVGFFTFMVHHTPWKIVTDFAVRCTVVKV